MKYKKGDLVTYRKYNDELHTIKVIATEEINGEQYVLYLYDSEGYPEIGVIDQGSIVESYSDDWMVI
jgi:hypothetical protein